jgi:hypothetical protein
MWLNEFFASIYEFFIGFYGDELGLHMYGNYPCPTAGFTNQSLYVPIGIFMLVSSLFFTLLFYYAINHPRFNRWWSWLLVLLVSSGLNFFIGFYRTSIDLKSESICPDLVKDPVSGFLYITNFNCIGFGFVNSILALLAFIILSFSLRWWSKNCSTCPFPN